MKKRGRNDPCPCGSGKKHKKCCGGRTVNVGAREPDANRSSSDACALSTLNIHPYALARMVAEPPPQLLSRLSKRDIAALREKWSIEKMARMSTDDIVSRLAALNIDASCIAFLHLAKNRTSAWDIGRIWVKGLGARPAMHDEDFIHLAGCELWKRYYPEVPSLEMLDDWVAEGYDLVKSRQEAKAIDVWVRVWDTVRDRLPPDAATFAAADAVFQCTQCFNNWIQDFVMAAQNAAIEDHPSAERGARFLFEVLSQFANEDAHTIASFRCDLGRLLFAAGRTDEAKALWAAVIRENPRSANGYVALADELSRPGSSSTDVECARQWLETAWSLPVDDAEAWDLESRIADLNAKQAADALNQGSHA